MWLYVCTVYTYFAYINIVYIPLTICGAGARRGEQWRVEARLGFLPRDLTTEETFL